VDWAVAVGLFGLVIAVFWRCGRLGFVDFDDPVYVLGNPHVLGGLSRASLRWAMGAQVAGNWHPLTLVSYLLDVRLFGPSARAMHLENVALHAASSAGWYLLLVWCTGRRGCSVLVAALFGVHPAHVESVAWISERKDVLCMLLLVGSLMAYVWYVRRASAVGYVAALVLFGLALLAKPMAVSEPGLLLVLDVWPLARVEFGASGSGSRRRWARLVGEKVPFLILAIGDGLATLAAQRQAKAVETLQHLGLGQRLENVCINYVRYAVKLAWPSDLAVVYPFRWNPPMLVVLLCLGLLLVVSGIVFMRRRRQRYLLSGWLWYLGTLAPVVGFVQVGRQSIADRYLYLPSVGLFIIFAWGGAALLQQIPGRRWGSTAAAVLGTAVVVAMAVLTLWQIPLWNDSITLFSHAAAVTEDDATIEDALGDAYLKQGRIDLAIEHFGDAASLAPQQVETQRSLGLVLLHFSPRAALPHLQMAADSTAATASDFYALGACLESLQRPAAAGDFYRMALARDPGLTSARAGLVRVERGEEGGRISPTVR
jgi:tetratricopeptide (TPR) repeat protein